MVILFTEDGIEIRCRNKKVEKQCTNFALATKQFNSIVAEKLFGLLNLLESAPTLNDVDAMRVYHLHELSGNLKGLFALDLGRRIGYRLIILPIADNDDKSNLSMWYRSVTVVSIEEVSNHYE